MADRDGHAHAGQLLRDRARLFRIAGVVADFEPQLSAEHAAGGVDVGHRLLGAVAHLPSESGLAAGHRTGRGDDNVLGHRRHGTEAEEKREGAEPQLVHVWSRF